MGVEPGPGVAAALPLPVPRATSRVAAGLGRLVLLLVAVNLVFLVALTSSELVPSGRIVTQLRSGSEHGMLPSSEYEYTLAGSDWHHGHLVDSFTECVALGMSLGDSSNPLRRAIQARNWGSCGYLSSHLNGTAPPTDPVGFVPDRYFRFWHGYQVLTRPIVAVAGMRGIREAGAGLIVAALVLLGVGVARLAGARAAVGLAAPLVLLTNFTELPYSFPHALDVTLALGGAGVLCLLLPRIGSDLWRLAAAALLAGAIFNFFTFLLTPGLALALLVFVVALGRWSSGGSWRRAALVRAGVAGGSWLFGYGGTFVCKWVLASLAVGWAPVWEDARATVSYRLTGVDSVRARHSPLEALRLNLGAYGRPTELLVLAIAVVLVGAVLLRRGRSGLIDFSVLAVPAAIPFLWILLLREHSTLHYWFTYRGLAISFGIVYAAALVARSAASPPP